MTMRRFTIPSADLAAPEITITNGTFHHMVRVLRIKEGAEVVIADGTGSERQGIVHSIDADTLSVRFTGEFSALPSLLPAITLYQGLPKGEKMEFIVQKCTELGIAAIVPFTAVRSVKKVRPERSAGLISRWQKIAEEAARQSGSRIPTVRLAAGLEEAICQSSSQCLKLLLWEDERQVTLRETIASLPVQNQVEVIVGPEGGITSEEAADARQKGFIPVSLGRNILRTETAGLVIVSILRFQWGDLGGDNPR